MKGAQTILARESFDSMLTARFTGLAKIKEDAGSAVNPMTSYKRSPDQAQESRIFLTAIRDWLFEPLVEAAGSDLENLAHLLHTDLAAMRFDELITLADSTGADLRIHCAFSSWKT